MKQVMRLCSLVLALAVTIGLLATTTAPAQAQARAQAHATPTISASTVSSDRSAPPATRPSRPQVQSIGHDYCGGWLHGPAWCLTFNRVEVGYVAAVSLATAAAFICGATALITCAIAAGIAAAIQRYVDRNGVCPKSRPKMRVEYFPSPGRVECV